MTTKLLSLCVGILALCSTSCKAQEPEPQPQPEPRTEYPKLSNPRANEKAQQVYKALWTISGEKILSATVANVDWNIREAENVHEWTGQWPALNVFDFINAHASKDVNPKGWLDYSDITVAKEWAAAGGLVGAMWHWNVPSNNGVDWTCSPGSQPKETSFDVEKIMDTKSAEYKQAIRQMDQIAGYLKQMQQAGITVIWRPLHEAAGNIYEYSGGKAWFWWGAKGAEPYKHLWRLMYDRFVNYHGLNNLIWVWTSQVKDSDFYPGDEYVDVIGRDNYYCLQYPVTKEYKTLQERYPNKLIALAECGNGDDVEMSLLGNIWKEGARFAWFMTWYDYDYNDGNSDEHKFATKEWWLEAFSHDYVVTRDEWAKIVNRK